MLEAKAVNKKGSETFKLSLNGKEIRIVLNSKLDYVLISTFDFNDITLLNGNNWNAEYNPRIEMLEIINQKKEVE